MRTGASFCESEPALRLSLAQLTAMVRAPNALPLPLPLPLLCDCRICCLASPMQQCACEAALEALEARVAAAAEAEAEAATATATEVTEGGEAGAGGEAKAATTNRLDGIRADAAVARNRIERQMVQVDGAIARLQHALAPQ